ncbi:MAG: DUF72 domain-containing protein [Bdellovibrionales bacterium]|nr:DUF72 domain-containing protein [Bdellovibrionales bacterium]
MSKIYVGMSGWTFEGWRGGFYPKGLAQKKELEYASRQVTSIEINGTFYALQKPATFERWYDETPKNFVFSIKAPKYITHVRRLKEVEEPLANFYASGLLCLKEKMGPVLWQFPPTVMLKDDRFERFLELLPYDAKSAARLAKQHGAKVEGRSYTKVSGDIPIRHAFEFRNPSFCKPEFISLLRKYGVAVVFAHSGLKSPYMEDVTADFVYARMHGQEGPYKNGYPKESITWLADRLCHWTKGTQPTDADCILSEPPKVKKRDAFVYFDTEAKDHAATDALNLLQELGR